MNQEHWKSAKERWIDDLNYVAKEADIELPGYTETEQSGLIDRCF